MRERKSDRKTEGNDCVIYCIIWKQLPLGMATLARCSRSAVSRIVTACVPAGVSSNLHTVCVCMSVFQDLRACTLLT